MIINVGVTVDDMIKLGASAHAAVLVSLGITVTTALHTGPFGYVVIEDNPETCATVVRHLADDASMPGDLRRTLVRVHGTFHELTDLSQSRANMRAGRLSPYEVAARREAEALLTCMMIAATDPMVAAIVSTHAAFFLR
ncbi:hypothetical protein ACIBKY_51085 [Nonomuraea sp. NPDC050394]|uniref:hypothetical protein n=1 Tax=Nonomuraea sp. NPDC050394 TaxID=3364363 RepID=UPI0037909FBB